MVKFIKEMGPVIFTSILTVTFASVVIALLALLCIGGLLSVHHLFFPEELYSVGYIEWAILVVGGALYSIGLIMAFSKK